MATSTNDGSQLISVRFKHLVKGKVYSRILRHLLKPGVAKGLTVTFTPATKTIQIAPGVVWLNCTDQSDDNLIVKSETRTVITKEINQAVPSEDMILYARFDWSESTSNYALFTARAISSLPALNEVRIARLEYNVGGTEIIAVYEDSTDYLFSNHDIQGLHILGGVDEQSLLFNGERENKWLIKNEGNYLSLYSDSTNTDKVPSSIDLEYVSRDFRKKIQINDLGIIKTAGNYPIDPEDLGTKGYIDSRVPTGIIYEYGGSVAPPGFLLGDGSAVSRVVYADLFAVYGVTFGVGDGVSTFNLPDRRAVVGKGAGTRNINGRSKTGGALGDILEDMFQGSYRFAGIGFTNNASFLYGQDTDDTPGTTSGIVATSGGLPDRQARVSSERDNGTDGVPRTGNSTRDNSLALNYIIKY